MTSWHNILDPEYVRLGLSLAERANQRRKETSVFPAQDQIFRALRTTPPEAVKVIIIGQDPYIRPGQAEGLAFSVCPGTPIPPSLQNIFRELNSDLGLPIPKNGSLLRWAENGVLLLNTTLTVDEGHSNSHSNWGWDKFTHHVLTKAVKFPQPIVILAWGRNAQTIASNLPLTANKKVISSAHQSPLSAYNGFFGSKPFSRTNAALLEMGGNPVDWNLLN